MIICVHNQDPGTPLDSQRPGLQRYQVGSVWVDVTDAADNAAAEAQYATYLVNQENDEKRVLLATAMVKRDTLLQHLAWQYIKAQEEPAGASKDQKVAAISAAISSLENFFNDPRIINAVDGQVRQAATIVYLEIFATLRTASLSTYNALRALDPL